jgi:hypothetical protein
MVATLGLAGCGDDDDAASTTDAAVTLSTEVTEDPRATEVTATDDTDDTGVSVAGTTETGDTTDGSTAGSGSGEVGSQDDYIEAARSEIGSEFEDQDVADCVGEAMISDDVYAAIEEAGLTVEQFSEDGPTGLSVDEAAAQDVAADFADCGDLRPELASDENELTCIEDNLSIEQMAEFLSYNLFGQETSAEVTTAYEAVEACITEATTATT